MKDYDYPLDLRILGSPNADPAVKSHPAYRGLFREYPYYVEGVGDRHRANRAFFWFVEEGGEEGTVQDLARAKDLVEAYRTCDPPQFFEIIELVSGDGSPEAGKTFLGCELVCGNHFPLSWNLDLTLPGDSEDDPLMPLFRLIENHFRLKLNEYRLFEDFDTAKFCLDCMLALQKFRPGLWESEENSDFKVVRLYKVD